MTENVEEIMIKLKQGEFDISDIPEEYAVDKEVVRTEREIGLRKSLNRGYDVLRQEFFVEELISYNDSYQKQNKIVFEKFDDFFDFLDGDIYDNACYFDCVFSKEIIEKYNLDVNKLYTKKSFVIDTVDDYSYTTLTDEDLTMYEFGESNNITVKYLINLFDSCDTYTKLNDAYAAYLRSNINRYVNINFFISGFAYKYARNKKRFKALMKFLAKENMNVNLVCELCLIFNPEAVLEQYISEQNSCLQNDKNIEYLKKFISELKNNECKIQKRIYFDRITHYFIERINVFRCVDVNKKNYEKYSCSNLCRPFETFESFIKYRKNNLNGCDLSEAFDLKIDFSKYQIDEYTKLPPEAYIDPRYFIRKYYKDNEYVVEQYWYDNYNNLIKKHRHVFKYFFDFAAFLKNDLSGAFLTYCDGLTNISSLADFKLDKIEMRSEVFKKNNLPYERYKYKKYLIDGFQKTKENEEQTKIALSQERNLIYPISKFVSRKYNIGYVTDLHLMHKIVNAGCESSEDIVYLLKKIADQIIEDGNEITLIGGDTSSDINVFEAFVKLLKINSSTSQRFVFVLGNHELWSAPKNVSLERIVNVYREIMELDGIYLLHNDLLYINELNDIRTINYSELVESNNDLLEEKIKHSRVVILGGIGFSGYNNEFNAQNGIYRYALTREEEIIESKKIESLYNKLEPILEKRNTIVFTHMPKKDWCADTNYHENFIYVSGHTHRNAYFDDGKKRMYADNQIGYENKNIHLKHFLVNKEYYCFDNYEDGIYEITPQEYRDFMRGKIIDLNFNRQTYVLYMLKKNNYYCFIHKSKSGSLTILNGGALKKLKQKNVQYYYDNMESMISLIRKPLEEYGKYQKIISEEIIKIGGSGHIHGCIIDIDFYTHIYINPIDLKLTGYSAENIINKEVYKNIPSLLKAECPELYENYCNLIASKKNTELIIAKKNEINIKPTQYLSTDIYKMSREIMKMQKTNYGILTAWYEDLIQINSLVKN